MISIPALVAAIGVAAACGGGGGAPAGGNSSPTAPSSPGTGGIGATIAIGSDISPKDIRIEVGQSVRFTNNGTRPRELRSDPHPTHGSCPLLDQSGRIAPGASVTVGPFNTAIACFYHEHNEPENGAFHGRIRIGVDDSGPMGPGYIRP